MNRPNHGQPWTRVQDAELLALTTAGNSLESIAAALGRTVVEVLERQQELGIAQPNGEQP